MYEKYHHHQHRHAIQDVFFNKTERNVAFYYNVRTNSYNATFYATLATLLFTNCYYSLDQEKAEDVFLFFPSHAFDYPGGVSSSIVRDTGEQWDFPNGWGNVNHMIIEGLQKCEAPQAQDVAFSLATH